MSTDKPDTEALDERVRAMLRGRRAVQRRKFPGLDVDIGVRPLAPAELADAKHAARTRILASGPDAIDLEPDAFQEALEQELVLRAVVDPDTAASDEPRPFFDSLATVLELDRPTRRALAHMAIVQHLAVVRPDAPLDEMRELLDHALSLATWTDRARARHAAGLCKFYGVRWQGELTDMQVGHFVRLTQTTDTDEET